jgi:hypothetical protein
MKHLDDMPKPEHLMDEPQLAVIVALETTLVAALRSLLAVHTDLLEDTFPRTIRPPDYWAERIINLGGQLAAALAKYRAALEEKDFPLADDF